MITKTQLTGTDKQIAYADKIRDMTIAEYDAYDAKFAQMGASADFRRIITETTQATFDAHTDSRWWLDEGAGMPGLKAHGVFVTLIRREASAAIKAAGIER